MGMAVPADNRVLLTAILTSVPKDVATCGLIFGCICIVSALFGNSLIIATVTRERNLRQRQNVFLVTWAVSEIIMVFIRDIFLIIVYAIGEWRFGRMMALINLFLFMSRNSFAISHVVVITVYRYALIVHPNVYRVISKTHNLVIAILYIFVMPVLLMLILDIDMYIKPYRFITKGMYAMKEDNGTLAEVPTANMASVFTSLILNCMVMAACYAHIYVFMKKSSRRVDNWTREMTQSDQRENEKKKISWIMYGLTHDGFRKGFVRLLRCPEKRVDTLEQRCSDRTVGVAVVKIENEYDPYLILQNIYRK
ncbi:hypothetical protein LSH36_966g00037 [Paralvinella palmiformis]|uniref:G-protein coupled receptors family 1 profile domain-containing protein n=1 Tax=Paralvinella palmiformis TaxID=53620 RepID=A0AAD9IXZ0_9ANNE|nr:hypothetical protein LSH36_966g00037 [Paralvinella palmiformis]